MITILPEHDPRAVANYFIKKYLQTKRKRLFRLDPLILENMVYLADTMHFECFKTYLINDQIQPGTHKDYSPVLEEALQDIANHEIPELITKEMAGNNDSEIKQRNTIIISQFSKPQLMILNEVYKVVSENNFKHTNFPYLYKTKTVSKLNLTTPIYQQDAREQQKSLQTRAQTLSANKAA